MLTWIFRFLSWLFGKEEVEDIEDIEVEIEEIYEYEPEEIQVGFSEEERLVYGLYPDDEAYKMSLISRILGK